MHLTDEDLKFEWDCWGNTKPWYCPLCNTLLASDAYQYCDGTDPEVPEEMWIPHKKIFITKPMTFEEFCEVQRKWEKERLKKI